MSADKITALNKELYDLISKKDWSNPRIKDIIKQQKVQTLLLAAKHLHGPPIEHPILRIPLRLTYPPP